jgi:ectoine hydroxylase-related dioxygenase (phytanoyl-CoA dioxygenase family)
VDNDYLVPELKDQQFHCPPVIHALLSESMGCAGWQLNSCGFMPVIPQAKAGQWHRDTRSMFHWNTEAEGDANKADILDVTRLPDYYFTLVVNLNEMTEEEGGETQFILGSHKTGILEAAENGKFAKNTAPKAGDALLFNGKIIHRGRQNNSTHKVRHALYVVYSAPWYYNA